MRASKKRSRIYRAVNQHSFTNLPLIPLEDSFDLGPEEIDTSFTVTVSATTAGCTFSFSASEWVFILVSK